MSDLLLDPYCPSGWYNGFTYLDTLNPDAVQSLIKQGLEPYKERFADQFGGRIPGVLPMSRKCLVSG